MKKIKVISFLSMALLGCGTASAQQSNTAAIERPSAQMGGGVRRQASTRTVSVAEVEHALS